jgi:hypothetical protein
MRENPYESPREVGYESPACQAWRQWLWDRLTLLGCGLAVFFMIWIPTTVGCVGYEFLGRGQ